MQIITNNIRVGLEKGLREEVKTMSKSERKAYLQKAADELLVLDYSLNSALKYSH